MKFAKLALLATTLAAAPYAASAQDAGTTIYGNDDQPIGTVASNDGTTVVVDTGSYKAPLPANLIGQREIGYSVNATKAQIDGMMAAQVAEAEKKLNAAIVVDAAVVSADSQPAGTIIAIDDSADQIIVENESGIISLTREAFALGTSGELTALYTGEQLASFTTEVPEGAEIRTASGQLVRAAATPEDEAEAAETTASAGGAAASTGASD